MGNVGFSSIFANFVSMQKYFFLLCYLCSAELVHKEGIHYNDLVEKYVHSDHVHSAPPNNSSPEGNRSCI